MNKIIDPETLDLTYEQLVLAYYDCRRNKRNSDKQIEFERDLGVNLMDLYRRLKNGSWIPGKSITFIVTRPKPREVFAACFEDRVVHHLLVRQIEHLFEQVFIEDNYNCRKGKGVLFGVKRLSQKIKDMSDNYAKKLYIAKFDLSGFFMSINKKILCQNLLDFLKEKYQYKNLEFILWITKLIVMHCPEENCEYKGDPKLKSLISPEKSLFGTGPNLGLPIGNLTSQIFANFYLHEFDIISSTKFNGGYGRYVDDFYVLSESKNKIKRFKKFAKNYLWDEYRVKLHDKKYYIQEVKKGVKFIGYVVKPGRIYIGNTTRANLHEIIYRMNCFINETQNLSEEELISCLKHFESQWNSYIGFMIHANSYNLRKQSWDELDPGWRQYFTRNPKFNVRLRKRYR